MPLRWLLSTLLSAVVLASIPATSSAATCAEFPSQQAAQQAVDGGHATISDPDHDGRICVISPG